MLNNPLSPISNPLATAPIYAHEAFMFSYLAAHYAGDITGRPTASYSRAFGPDVTKVFPAQGANMPGFLMAFWLERRPTKVMIAIPGLQSLTQLAEAIALSGSVAVTGISGRVHEYAKLLTDAVYATALADEHYLTATNHRAHEITCSGFSIGASVAELLANYLHRDDSTRSIKCYKFGAPRVGTNTWKLATRNRFPLQSWYTFRDPISLWPRDGVQTNPFVSITTGSPYVWYFRDPSPQVWDQDGLHSHGYNENQDGPASWASAYRFLTGDFDSEPWFSHGRHQYRWTFLQWLVLNLSGLNFDRFKFLEHPDENKWQDKNVLNNPWDNTWFGLNETPTDYENDDGRDHGGTSEGGDWGTPEGPRVQTLQNPGLFVGPLQERGAWSVAKPTAHRHARRLNRFVR